MRSKGKNGVRKKVKGRVGLMKRERVFFGTCDWQLRANGSSAGSSPAMALSSGEGERTKKASVLNTVEKVGPLIR